jgi:hypothetical protein
LIFYAAAVLFLANFALGVLVQFGVVDTKPFRWLHHALFFAVFASAAFRRRRRVFCRVRRTLGALAGPRPVRGAAAGAGRHVRPRGARRYALIFYATGFVWDALGG